MTKEIFHAYLRVQYSGVTNMFDVTRVVAYSDNVLNKDLCFDIMKNYDKYLTEFGDLEE